MKKLFAVVLMITLCVAFAGCVEDKSVSGADSEAAADAKEEITVDLTDLYSYTLPADAEESFDFEKGEGVTDERVFLLNDGDIIVRSFIITDEPGCFPGLVEYLYEDIDTDIGYSEFYDTALATAVDEISDGEGGTFYRKSYFWPSGGSTLCCISAASYAEDDLKTGDSILGTVKKNGETAREDWEVPPNAEELLTPSQEEIDQAMMQEAQESMQQYYEEDDQYYDYDTSLGKRGR